MFWIGSNSSRYETNLHHRSVCELQELCSSFDADFVGIAAWVPTQLVMTPLCPRKPVVGYESSELIPGTMHGRTTCFCSNGGTKSRNRLNAIKVTAHACKSPQRYYSKRGSNKAFKRCNSKRYYSKRCTGFV